MMEGRERAWISLAAAGAVAMAGASLCGVFVVRGRMHERLVQRLAGQLEEVRGFQQRGLDADAVVDAFEGSLRRGTRQLPKTDISRVLIGEKFQVDGGEEDAGQGWQTQHLRIMSEALPSDKFLALLPVLCGEQFGFRLREADIHSLAGRRGVLEVDVQFTRMLPPQ